MSKAVPALYEDISLSTSILGAKLPAAATAYGRHLYYFIYESRDFEGGHFIASSSS